MPVLHIENRIVFGLLRYLVEIEIQRSVVFPEQHHEANRVRTDFIDDFSQSNKVARPFGHFDRLTVTHQFHELAKPDNDIGFAAGYCLADSLQPFCVTTMIGTQDIDRFLETPFELVLEVGNVGCEIGIRPIRLFQCPVRIITKIARPKERLFAVFPVFRHLSFGWRQGPLIDKPLFPQPIQHMVDLRTIGTAPVMERFFRKENLVFDSKCRQVCSYKIEHRRHRGLLHDWKPFGIRHFPQFFAKLVLEQRPYRFEIIAWIKTRRDFAYVFTESLAVPKVCAPRKSLDLRSRVINVVFLDDIVAGKSQQIGKSIANDGTANVSDMHWSGRVRRHIFDIHLRRRLQSSRSKALTKTKNTAEDPLPNGRCDPEVDEPRSSYRRLGYVRVLIEFLDEFFGKVARFHLERFCKHHCCIGCEVAVIGIPRGFDHYARQIR